MRLCLDELYDPRIAQGLRELGHDVTAAQEEEPLRGLSDRALWDRLQQEGCALLTEDIRGFIGLVNEAATSGTRHFGVVFASARMLRRRDTVGAFVDRLDELLSRFPGDDDFADRVEWLQP